MASAWVAASWLVVETLLTLMTTYFLALRRGPTWSSMAVGAAARFFRRLSPLTRATVEFRAGAEIWATSGRSAGVRTVNCKIVRREKVAGTWTASPIRIRFYHL